MSASSYGLPRHSVFANAIKSAASQWAASASAHAVLASCYGLNSLGRRSTARATATKGAASHWVAIANPHAVLARTYGLSSPRRCSNATKRPASHWADFVVNAHAVLASSYGLNSPGLRPAALANDSHSAESQSLAIASAHDGMASCYWLAWAPLRRPRHRHKDSCIPLNCYGKRPRCVGESLRTQLAQAPLRYLRSSLL